jgi:hypothetical protein
MKAELDQVIEWLTGFGESSLMSFVAEAEQHPVSLTPIG